MDLVEARLRADPRCKVSCSLILSDNKHKASVQLQAVIIPDRVLQAEEPLAACPRSYISHLHRDSSRNKRGGAEKPH